MKYPKFIIQNDTLIIGIVEFHSELKQDNSPVKGGGWFNTKLNQDDTQSITFWKDSQEFGKCSKQAIQNCIDNGKVIGLDLSDYDTININV